MASRSKVRPLSKEIAAAQRQLDRKSLVLKRRAFQRIQARYEKNSSLLGRARCAAGEYLEALEKVYGRQMQEIEEVRRFLEAHELSDA